MVSLKNPTKKLGDNMEKQKEKLIKVLEKVPEFKGMKIIIPDEVLEKINPEIIQDLLNE